MKKLIAIYLVLFVVNSFSAWSNDLKKNQPVDYVNSLIGTNNNKSFSHGNTYPAVARPFGMNFWTPQTGMMNDTWIYTYNSDSIRGFRHTHMPSPWIGDYAAFSIMPVSGKLEIKDKNRASSFSHAEEIATPYYYAVKLHDSEILSEITATERCGYMQFTFDKNEDNYLVLDAYHQGALIKIIPEKQMIVGYCQNRFGGTPDNFRSYFVIMFDVPFDSFGVWNEKEIFHKKTELTDFYAGAYIKLRSTNKKVGIKIASSFISLDQAQQNLSSEIGSIGFEALKKQSYDCWNKHLSKVIVDDENEEHKKTFYSNFYRASLFPRKLYELNKNGEAMYYSPYNGKISKGYMYTDNGFWDTFRAAHPWHTLISPSISKEIIQSLVNAYRDGGWLPSWASPGYRDSMIGSHAVAIIADAYQKGIKDFDIEKAFEAALKDCFEPAPKKYMGRYGFDAYNKKGYIPYPEYEQSTSMSIEYAYDDFCIVQLAKMMGKDKKIINQFSERAMNYTHSFDHKTGFMRPRKENGEWYTPFSPYLWGGPFTEGNAWQYTWSVFHDVQGLINLYGSNEAFVEKLDSVFIAPLHAPLYGRYFNEIAEMHQASFGQYAHGNQPAQHMPYLYNYASQPWKTQRLVRKITNQLYNSSQNGYCGDEDNGQTSSWYLFSALGFYPVCPASGEYVIGSPLFKSVKISLENGNTFTIEAPENSEENFYIRKKTFNSKPYSKHFILHKDVSDGGLLLFDMNNRPAKDDIVIEVKDLPYSLSKPNK